MNIVGITGRLTRDPELRKTSQGKSVLSASIAVDKRGNQTADFIGIVAWEKTAETICNYCHKGDEVIITGHLGTSQYQDKSGNKRSETFVVVDRFEFGRKKNREEPTAQQYGFDTGTDIGINTEEELPF